MKRICIILSVALIILLFTSCASVSKNELIDEDIPRSTLEITEDEETVTDEVEPSKETLSQSKLEKECVEDTGEASELYIEDTSYETLKDAVIDSNVKLEENKVFDSNSQYYVKNLIASSNTTFNPNQTNRSSNIRLASGYVNGIILMPNEEFSFNEIVGERTAEKGFLPADIFVGNSIAQGYGGGICQVSSTICIAVKQTSMKIIEQNPHSQRVSYTTIDNEAMINYGTSDFRFINTHSFPIIIEISFEPLEDREIIKCDIFSFE